MPSRSSKMHPSCPKMGQRCFQMSQDGLRCLQDAPKMSQRCAKMRQDGLYLVPRCLPNFPKCAQDPPKMPPKLSNMCPRSPKRFPRWPKMLQDTPKKSQDGTKMLQGCPKNSERMTMNCFANASRMLTRFCQDDPKCNHYTRFFHQHRSERSERRAQRHRSKQQGDLTMLPNTRHNTRHI